VSYSTVVQNEERKNEWRRASVLTINGFPGQSRHALNTLEYYAHYNMSQTKYNIHEPWYPFNSYLYYNWNLRN
jgi:hypothetical protein